MKAEQNRITVETNLLDHKGNIEQPGWASRSLYKYNRNMIKAPALRIKEWDYYCILSSECGLALTAADNGYMGFFAVTLFDFNKNTETSGSVMTILPMGKLRMPASSSSGDVLVNEKNIGMSFVHEGNKRVLRLDYPGFNRGAGITAEIVLLPPVEDYDRMVIATPFGKLGKPKRGRFYFNEKHNCLRATGTVRSGALSCEFGGDDAWAVLDWGRGVWTYRNTWYWGSASGSVDGIPFGFNLGYGFGDTSAATENMLFYNGKAHKLDEVAFNIPKDAGGNDSFMEPWTFTSSDSRFEMDFRPVIDRFDDTNVLLIRSSQHQVFGYFSGKAVLDDGTVIEIKDFLGFAEKVYNRW